ncbi:hypothetical protein [Streptomyces alboflavus]|uniref:hypothetical protein n=1 Tax=Streptomyces alboflavus TaxID=67267 RepID=UPI00368674EC
MMTAAVEVDVEQVLEHCEEARLLPPIYDPTRLEQLGDRLLVDLSALVESELVDSPVGMVRQQLSIASGFVREHSRPSLGEDPHDHLHRMAWHTRTLAYLLRDRRSQTRAGDEDQ